MTCIDERVEHILSGDEFKEDLRDIFEELMEKGELSIEKRIRSMEQVLYKMS